MAADLISIITSLNFYWYYMCLCAYSFTVPDFELGIGRIILLHSSLQQGWSPTPKKHLVMLGTALGLTTGEDAIDVQWIEAK